MPGTITLDRSRYQLQTVVRNEVLREVGEHFVLNESLVRLETELLTSTETVRFTFNAPATWVQHLRKRLKLKYRVVEEERIFDCRAIFPAAILTLPEDRFGPVVFHVEDRRAK